MSSFKSAEFRAKFFKEQLESSSSSLIKDIKEALTEDYFQYSGPYIIYSLILKEGFDDLRKIIKDNKDNIKQGDLEDFIYDLRKIGKMNKEKYNDIIPETNYLNTSENKEVDFNKFAKELLKTNCYVNLKDLNFIANKIVDIDFEVKKKDLKNYMIDNAKPILKHCDFKKEDGISFKKFLKVNLNKNFDDFTETFNKAIVKSKSDLPEFLVSKLTEEMKKNEELFKNDKNIEFLENVSSSIDKKLEKYCSEFGDNSDEYNSLMEAKEKFEKHFSSIKNDKSDVSDRDL